MKLRAAWQLLTAIPLVALLCPTGVVARTQLASVAVLHGTCAALGVTKYNFARICSPTLINEVYKNGRTGFTFMLKGGATVVFSGVAPQVKLGPDAVIQPVDHVIWQFDAGVPAHTFPVVGKCRFENPYKGQAHITCEATGSDGEYRASFLTDGSEPSLKEF